jgi:tetratricopeptide (TPR) repeat protein
MDPCPSENELVALRDVRVVEHLDECEACREVVAALAREPGAPEAVRVGRYRVLGTLGAGGMALVYQASDPELGRKVALKVVPSLGDAGELRARVTREAQAMARLSHPNVVQVFGVESDGQRLFIAMELVEGQTLADWLAAEPRGWRAVLGVFCDAGRGLAAAHGAGLVHRDFKPENVLVGKDARVRVSDFGLTYPEAEVGHAVPAGTLLYAAPELMAGRPVDARADQYSFCVALSRALGGRGPAGLKRTLAQGLARRPEDRHATMEALLSALERSTRSRTGWWLAWAGLALAATAGGALYTRAERCRGEPKWSGVWDPARQARVSAAFRATQVAYADSALQAAARGLDAYESAWSSAFAASCTSSSQLDRQMVCLSRALDKARALTDVWLEPDSQVVLQAPQAVADLPSPASCASSLRAAPTPAERELRPAVDRAWALTQAGKAAAGTDLARPALERARALGDPALEAESGWVLGHALFRAGAFAAARDAFRQAGLAAEAAGDDEQVARAWIGESDSLSRLGLFDDALEHVAFADGAVARLHRPPELTASVDSTRGKSLLALGRLAEARAAFEEALSLRERALPPEHPVIGSSWKDLGALTLREGNLPEAIRILRRALVMREQALGPQHPDVATVLTDLGRALMRSGQEGEAATHLQRALDVRTRTLGPEHPDVATTLAVIAELDVKTGHPDRAVEELARAIEIRRAALGPEHPNTLEAERQLDALRGSTHPSKKEVRDGRDGP